MASVATRLDDPRLSDRFGTEQREAVSEPARGAVIPWRCRAAIQLIRQHVCEHFYLREMRDP